MKLYEIFFDKKNSSLMPLEDYIERCVPCNPKNRNLVQVLVAMKNVATSPIEFEDRMLEMFEKLDKDPSVRFMAPEVLEPIMWEMCQEQMIKHFYNENKKFVAIWNDEVK